MIRLFRFLRLARLLVREKILAESVEHGEGLIQDHVRRLANEKQELAKVRRRIDQNTDATNIIKRITA